VSGEKLGADQSQAQKGPNFGGGAYHLKVNNNRVRPESGGDVGKREKESKEKPVNIHVQRLRRGCGGKQGDN